MGIYFPCRHNNKIFMWDSDSCLDNVAWWSNNFSVDGTEAVKTKAANAWGIYDMHGNEHRIGFIIVTAMHLQMEALGKSLQAQHIVSTAVALVTLPIMRE
jgi:hypothetical protein